MSENFHELQGWRAVPAGLLLAFASKAGINAFFWDPLETVLPFGPLTSCLLPLFLFPGLMLASWAAGVHYDRAFGRMETKRTSWQWPAKAFALWWLWMILGIIPYRSPLQGSLSGLGMAWYFGHRPGAWRERPYCGALAVLFLTAGLLPLLAGPFRFGGFPQPVSYPDVLVAVFGVAVSVQGLLDHRFLVENLAAPPPPEDGEGALEGGQ